MSIFPNISNEMRKSSKITGGWFITSYLLMFVKSMKATLQAMVFEVLVALWSLQWGFHWDDLVLAHSTVFQCFISVPLNWWTASMHRLGDPIRNIASGQISKSTEVPRPNSRLEIQKLGTRIKTSLAWNVYRCQTSSQVGLVNGPPLAATGCISPQGLRTAPRASQGTHFGRSRPSSHPMQRQSHQPDPIRQGCVGFWDMFSNARQHLYI